LRERWGGREVRGETLNGAESTTVLFPATFSIENRNTNLVLGLEGFGFGVLGVGVRAQGFGFRDPGFGFGVWGLGLRVEG